MARSFRAGGHVLDEEGRWRPEEVLQRVADVPAELVAAPEPPPAEPPRLETRAVEDEPPEDVPEDASADEQPIDEGPQRAECPDCGKDIAVRKDGSLRKHTCIDVDEG